MTSESTGTNEVERVPGAALLRPGYGLVLEMTSRGGKEYGDSAVNDGEDGRRLIARVETVDNAEHERCVTSVRNAVLKLFRTETVHTDIGIWYADDHMLNRIEEKMRQFRADIMRINQRSRELGSKRETRGEYFAAPWQHNDPKLRIRLGQMIYDRIKKLREAYTQKHVDAYRTAILRCTLLDKLVEDPQASLIRTAIDGTEQQRPLIIRHNGGKNVPIELLSKAAEEIKFDYGPVDAALEEFEPAAKLFYAELPEIPAPVS